METSRPLAGLRALVATAASVGAPGDVPAISPFLAPRIAETADGAAHSEPAEPAGATPGHSVAAAVAVLEGLAPATVTIEEAGLPEAFLGPVAGRAPTEMGGAGDAEPSSAPPPSGRRTRRLSGGSLATTPARTVARGRGQTAGSLPRSPVIADGCVASSCRKA